MSSEDVAIRVSDLAKHYLIYDRPDLRLKQMLAPRVRRAVGLTPRNYYRDFAALRGVSFEVGRGETVGIVGRNGSGKSTLLQIICGTLAASRGTVEVRGRIAALLELGAGFNPEFTGRENVYLYGAILGLSRSEVRRRFDAIAEFADIGAFLDQPIKTYSSGMHVRLAFATAINVDPDILVVDEALSVGDEAFKRKCHARIEQIQKNGATILFVSHSAQAIVQICSRAMLIDSGEMILQGEPKAVVAHYQRLVNAPAAAAKQVRDEIVALRAVGDTAIVAATPLTAEANEDHDDLLGDDEEPGPERESIDDDFYDVNMTTKSLVAMKPNGASIGGLRLLNAAGEQTNVLKRGGRYTLEYDVVFSAHVRDVGFVFTVRSTAGISIAGGNTFRDPSTRLASAAPGQHYRVRFQFDAIMRPGPYFIGCVVRGYLNNELRTLHRMYDALMFKIGPEKATLANGLVDCRPVFESMLLSLQDE